MPPETIPGRGLEPERAQRGRLGGRRGASAGAFFFLLSLSLCVSEAALFDGLFCMLNIFRESFPLRAVLPEASLFVFRRSSQPVG